MSDLVDNEHEVEDLDELNVPEPAVKKDEPVTFEDLAGGSKEDDVWEDVALEDGEFFDIKDEKVEDVVEEDAETGDAEKIKEDIIKHLDGKTELTIKGKKYDLADLSPEEVVKRFQLAGRAYEVMQQSAEDSKDMARLVEQAVDSKMRHLVQGQQAAGKTSDDEQSIPDFLKPQELDSDEVKALKQSQALLLKEIGSLKTNVDARTDQFAEQQFVTNVERYQSEFPAASIDEVIAIKSLRPDLDEKDIMRASHDHYSSTDFIKTALEANPEAKRELSEVFIKEYKAKVQKARGQTVPRRRSGGSVSQKVTEKTPKPIRTFDDIEARGEEIEAYLRKRKANQG